MRILASLVILLITQTGFAAQGYIEKDGVRMNVEDSFAVLDKAKGKLTIYFLPGKLSDEGKRNIKEKSAFFALVDKPSPDPDKWSWYPYAKLELSNRTGKFETKQDLGHYYLMAYGIKKKNYTDNLNGNLKHDNSVAIESYRFSGQGVSFHFSGKEDYFKIQWQLDVAAEIQ